MEKEFKNFWNWYTALGGVGTITKEKRYEITLKFKDYDIPRAGANAN